MHDEVAIQTSLPLDRVAENLRRSRVSVALFALISLPTVAYVGQYLAFVFLLWIVPLFGKLGWIAFLMADFLLVAALMVFAFRWVYQTATRRLISAVRATPLRESDEVEFTRAAQNMSIASGLPMPALYVIEESATNLLAVGVSPADSAIVATRGFLRAVQTRELEAAVAHAFAQIGNGDTRLDTLLASGVRFLKIPGSAVSWFCRRLGRFAAQFGMVGWGCLSLLAAWMLIPFALSMLWGLTDPDFWWICWIALFFLVYVFFAGPLLAGLMARKVSRQRKYLADSDAVMLTRFPVGLVRVLAKLAAAGSTYSRAPTEAANLYFVDPISEGSSWWARLNDSHPPAPERIAAVSYLGARVPASEAHEASAQGAEFAALAADSGVSLLEDRSGLHASERDETSRRLLLLEDVPLLASPRAGSEFLGTVDSGTGLTVLTDHAQFFEVVTSDDRVGWISKLARFERLA